MREIERQTAALLNASPLGGGRTFITTVSKILAHTDVIKISTTPKIYSALPHQ